MGQPLQAEGECQINSITDQASTSDFCLDVSVVAYSSFIHLVESCGKTSNAAF